MTETGKVRELRENLVVVAPDRSAGCFGCMNQECKNRSGLITAENPEGLSLREGQTVEVGVAGASLLSQALIAFLPPILGFLLGFNLSRLVFPFPTAPDGASVGMGLLFLFAAAFIVYLVRKKRPAGSGYRVTRIIA
jgi:sigma-E factor negative regulatory protein RseC